jgi:hypothetical protein
MLLYQLLPMLFSLLILSSQRTFQLESNNVKILDKSLILSIYPNVDSDSTLKSFNFSYQNIASIEDNIFNNENIISIDLSNNMIQKLNAFTFKGLSNLNEINLTNNHLTSLNINNDAFKGLDHLEYIYISKNVSFCKSNNSILSHDKDKITICYNDTKYQYYDLVHIQ